MPFERHKLRQVLLGELLLTFLAKITLNIEQSSHPTEVKLFLCRVIFHDLDLKSFLQKNLWLINKKGSLIKCTFSCLGPRSFLFTWPSPFRVGLGLVPDPDPEAKFLLRD